MTVAARQLEEPEFERELIRRFFNARSYFFLCFSERLREELPPELPGSEEDYALVAALLDRLQSSDNPREELERLANLEPIRNYLGELDRSVQEFKQRPMPPDELKAAIEDVATAFLDAVLQSIRAPERRTRLAEYLGFTSAVEDHVPETPDVAFVEEQLAPQPPRSDLFEEEEFLQGHFRAIVAEQLAGTHASSRNLDARISHLKKALLEVRDAAMIHGEEDIEMLCFKTVEILNRALNGNAPKAAAVHLAEKVRDFVERFATVTQQDEESLRVLMGILQGALRGHFPSPEMAGTTAKETTDEPATPVQREPEPPSTELEAAAKAESSIEDIAEPEASEQTTAQVQESSGAEEELDFVGLVGVDDFLQFEQEETEEEREEERIAIAEAESQESNGARPRDTASQQQDDSIDEPEFKLPGEDDEELKALIQEVRQHSWRAKETDWVGEEGPSQPSEHNVDQTEEPFGETAPAAGPYGQFQADATLYLSVIESALETLRSEPEKASALEDLELAAQSIKSILKNLGDRKLWIVASSLGAAASRAARAEKPVDEGFLRAAESAVQLLSAGPTQSLNGLLETTVKQLTSWAHGEREAGPSELTVKEVASPPGPAHDLDAQRPKFRLRGHGRNQQT